MFKRYILGIDNFIIIIYKLDYNKKSCLVIIFIINKNARVNFYYIIWFFNLAIFEK